jgi:hypothetical protein
MFVAYLPGLGKHVGREKDHWIMALTQDDFVGAIARLNDLTRRQVIKWSPSSPPAREPDAGPFASAVEMLRGSRPKIAYEALYDERILRSTQYESTINPLGPGYAYTLDVRDEHGNVTFEFPNVEGIGDLFRSVQTQKLDIEGFIKKLVAG